MRNSANHHRADKLPAPLAFVAPAAKRPLPRASPPPSKRSGATLAGSDPAASGAAPPPLPTVRASSRPVPLAHHETQTLFENPLLLSPAPALPENDAPPPDEASVPGLRPGSATVADEAHVHAVLKVAKQRITQLEEEMFYLRTEIACKAAEEQHRKLPEEKVRLVGLCADLSASLTRRLPGQNRPTGSALGVQGTGSQRGRRRNSLAAAHARRERRDSGPGASCGWRFRARRAAARAGRDVRGRAAVAAARHC
jgi:hypothetical protein